MLKNLNWIKTLIPVKESNGVVINNPQTVVIHNNPDSPFSPNPEDEIPYEDEPVQLNINRAGMDPGLGDASEEIPYEDENLDINNIPQQPLPAPVDNTIPQEIPISPVVPQMGEEEIPPYEDEPVSSDLQQTLPTSEVPGMVPPPVEQPQTNMDVPPVDISQQLPPQDMSQSMAPPVQGEEEIPPYEDETPNQDVSLGMPQMGAPVPPMPQDPQMTPMPTDMGVPPTGEEIPYEDEPQMQMDPTQGIPPISGMMPPQQDLSTMNVPQDGVGIPPTDEVPYEDEMPMVDPNQMMAPQMGVDPSQGQMPADISAAPQIDPMTGQPIQQPMGMDPSMMSADPNMAAGMPPGQPQIDPMTGMPVEGQAPAIDPMTGMPMAGQQPEIDPMTGMPVYEDETLGPDGMPVDTIGNIDVTLTKPVELKDIAKLKELSYIHDTLLQLKKILSHKSQITYEKLATRLKDAIDMFDELIKNLDSYSEVIEDLIIKYKRFILVLLMEIKKLQDINMEKNK